jgi:hypothetical protein
MPELRSIEDAERGAAAPRASEDSPRRAVTAQHTYGHDVTRAGSLPYRRAGEIMRRTFQRANALPIRLSDVERKVLECVVTATLGRSKLLDEWTITGLTRCSLGVDDHEPVHGRERNAVSQALNHLAGLNLVQVDRRGAGRSARVVIGPAIDGDSQSIEFDEDHPSLRHLGSDGANVGNGRGLPTGSDGGHTSHREVPRATESDNEHQQPDAEERERVHQELARLREARGFASREPNLIADPHDMADDAREPVPTVVFETDLVDVVFEDGISE